MTPTISPAMAMIIPNHALRHGLRVLSPTVRHLMSPSLRLSLHRGYHLLVHKLLPQLP